MTSNIQLNKLTEKWKSAEYPESRLEKSDMKDELRCQENQEYYTV